MIGLALLLAIGPLQPGYIFTDGPVEGMVAGEAREASDGMWLVDVDFGPVGQSPLNDEKAEILASLLSGDFVPTGVTYNICEWNDEYNAPVCQSGKPSRISWPEACEIRDTYSYSSVDAVRVEWICEGGKDSFAMVNFEEDEIPLIRTWIGVMPVPVRSAN